MRSLGPAAVDTKGREGKVGTQGTGEWEALLRRALGGGGIKAGTGGPGGTGWGGWGEAGGGGLKGVDAMGPS